MTSAVISPSVSGYHVPGPGAEISAQDLHAWSPSDLREGFSKLLGVGSESHSETATQISPGYSRKHVAKGHTYCQVTVRQLSHVRSLFLFLPCGNVHNMD